jgi:hypothetical protein
VADDLIREDIVAKTPATELDAMRSAVQSQSPVLLAWLGGPKAKGPKWSKEFIAFSALLMAADGC